MIYVFCSILWIVEILKKTKMLCFYKQKMYFSQIVSKKAKITISFFMKNSKNNNVKFIISIQYFAYHKGKNIDLLRFHLGNQKLFLTNKIFRKKQNDWPIKMSRYHATTLET